LLLARGRERGTFSVTIAATSLAVLLFAALWVNREGLVARLDTTLSGGVGRPVIWAETLPLVRDFWPAGTGIGTYGESMLRYQRTRTGTLFNQAHNEYLQLVAEGGLLVTLPAAVALWQWVLVARRRLRDPDDRFWIRAGAMAGICGLAVQSVFETGLRMPANALLFALLAAIVIHEPRVPASRGPA
jgi:O-antigen ligase